HRRRVRGQRLGAAEADREMRDLERVEESERLLLAALEVEREGGAGAGAMAAVDVGLAPFLEEAQITHALDLGMVLEEAADLLGILAGAGHPELERLEAAQEHPGGVGICDRADRVPQHADLVDQLPGTGDAAGDEVRM